MADLRDTIAKSTGPAALGGQAVVAAARQAPPSRRRPSIVTVFACRGAGEKLKERKRLPSGAGAWACPRRQLFVKSKSLLFELEFQRDEGLWATSDTVPPKNKMRAGQG